MHFISYLIGICLPLAIAQTEQTAFVKGGYDSSPTLKYGHCYIINTVERGTELGHQLGDHWYRFGSNTQDHALQVCYSHYDCTRHNDQPLSQDDYWYFLDRRGTWISGAPAWLARTDAYMSSVEVSKGESALKMVFGDRYSPGDRTFCFKPGDQVNAGWVFSPEFGLQFTGDGKCMEVWYREVECPSIPPLWWEKPDPDRP
ncbi:hypothetical protein BDV25DRAFT_137318 [Aspergillus avenaceus]|uniref:Uncharacterized protein n=1 Tax=Aspergillus avenaceus TaxID=36643 RepID=A0A5N6U361_ASPAV|nr:hypothetical protein BDV25DRAFT_137318 [Aspergillus avenaceus]